MSGFSTPAILLRRIEYGDYDLIATFLTRAKGKISVIAKNAKKSRKRFSGLLEPFTALDLVCRLLL
ncbi:MAG: recombination protein O N-terminal domain-containing protein, partial [Desulfobacterales bacterium]|nr:recombination protein O N-terminal domain-containing protein [Desulfobacterales bacterium]